MVEWFQDAIQGHTFAAWVVPDERSLEVSWLCGPYSAVFSNGAGAMVFHLTFLTRGLTILPVLMVVRQRDVKDGRPEVPMTLC